MTGAGAPAEAPSYPRLAELTTMRVGGPPAALLTATTEEELVEAVRATDRAREPLLVVGGGSNLLVADEGFPGTAVLVRTAGIEVREERVGDGVRVTVAAGEVWDDVVARAVAQGWSGIEALSGIPGATGATPVQNVGAYGQEVAQTITQVRVWDRVQEQVRTMVPAELAFAYRTSVLKESMVGPAGAAGAVGTAGAVGAVTPRYVVLTVTFLLQPTPSSQPVEYAALADGLGVQLGARVPLGEAREAVLDQRRRRGMVLDAADHDTWSCGSFFTNPILPVAEFEQFAARAAERLGPQGPVPPRFPSAEGTVKTSAAWLIDKAGFTKGHGLPGPAALSTKHTLALTNRGPAKAADLVALAREVRDGVQEVFGVRLVNEPVLVGLEL